MTITNQAITPSGNTHKYSLSNVSEVTTTRSTLAISPDNTTLYFANGTTLEMSTDDATTFTGIHDFGMSIDGFLTFADGEAGVATSQGGGGSRIWRSTGWATNKLTATWAVTLDNSAHANAKFTSAFSFHQANVASNGIVVTNEYGAQTLGNGNAADVNAARRAYITLNHGATWTQIFDIYTDGAKQQPGGCHCHSIAYDEADDRVFLSIGDNTGDGYAVAGTGNMQLAYSDSHGAAGSWVFFPSSILGPDYAGNFGQGSASPQVTTIKVTPSAIILMPDCRPYGVFVIPKTGYRQYGVPHLVSMLDGGAPSNVIGQGITQNVGSTLASPKPMFYGYNNSAGMRAHLMMSHDNGLNNYEVWTGAKALSGGVGIQVFGPTVNGKIVGNTGYSTSKLFKATLVGPT